jgi:peroxiredoxin
MIRRTILISCLVLTLTAIGPVGSAQQSAESLLQSVTLASRAQQALSADIVLTWRTGGVTKRSSGTITLRKPNYAVITLNGDYSQRLLISDGKTRFLVDHDKGCVREETSDDGATVNSPWWGMPFRFFFTQSLNPFGSAPDTGVVYEDFHTTTIAGIPVRGLAFHGNSPMGGYTARVLFNEDGDLVQSSIQFGAGPGAALFEASLSYVRHTKQPLGYYRFTPAAEQIQACTSRSMLALGTQAPEFTLPTLDGNTVSLAKERQGKRGVLVDFWFYNCAPCRIEFPELEKLYEQFKSQGFDIVAVDKGDSASTISEYVRRAGLSFPVALGGEISKDSIFARYNVTETFPGTYLLDGNGTIVYRSTGEDLQGLTRALALLGFH